MSPVDLRTLVREIPDFPQGGAIVGCALLIELSFLSGRERLDPYPVHAVLEYAS